MLTATALADAYHGNAIYENCLLNNRPNQEIHMSGLKQQTASDNSIERQCNDAPLFSVIITTYNRPTLLADALASLSKQTFDDFEAILVNDNGSPVEPLLIEASFPITYIRQARNSGPAAARNAAHRLARGHYIVYLDDDDRFQADHLETLAQAIARHPDEVIYTDAVFITEDLIEDQRIDRRREQRYTHGEYSRERLMINNYIPVNTFAFPRRLLELVDGFDEALEGLEDWDFLMTLARHINFRHVPRETVEVRMRTAKSDATRRSILAMQRYPTLHRQLYERHPDLASDAIRHGRAAMLRHLDTRLSQGQRQNNWLECRTLTPVQRELARAQLASHKATPTFAIAVIDLEGNATKLTATLDSLETARAQYPNLLPLVISTSTDRIECFPATTVRVTRDNWLDALNQSIAQTHFDWLGLIHAGDEVIANGLLINGLELLSAPDCRALYFDVMYRQAGGNEGPVLRPDFNLDYLLSLPSVMGRNWLFRRDALLEVGGFDSRFKQNPEFELVLRMITATGTQGLGHIAEVVLKTESPPIQELAEERQAILEHLSIRGYKHAQAKFEPTGQYRIHYLHTSQPLVSILILAGDNLSHLQRCTDSLLERTQYSHYQVLLINDKPEARDVNTWLQAVEGLDEERLRVIAPPAPIAPSTALDYAVEHAQGSYILLLSPDTAAIKEDWLDELLNHAQRPEVGAVGAKLIAPEGTVLHAGLILGLDGVAGPAFAGEPMESSGYLQRLQVDQNYSAVSKDCLMVSREALSNVNGFGSAELIHHFGVDLCLRLREAGYLNVWAANALLLSSAKTRVPPPADEDLIIYQKRLPRLARDPAYNPNLSLSNASGFSLADNALSWRPLSSWKPLPTVLAFPLGHTADQHYRLNKPMLAMTESGLIESVSTQAFLQPCELELLRPDSIIIQGGLNNIPSPILLQIKKLSNAFKVVDVGEYSATIQPRTLPIAQHLHQALAFADRVLVPTQSFAEAIGCTQTEIIVVPSRLPVKPWGSLVSTRDTSQRLRIGWAACAHTAEDAGILTEVIKDLAEEVEWIIIGDCPAELRRYIHEIHDETDIAQFPHKLAQLNLDLALVPLMDTPFNRCKSNLQVLKYGACGYPVIRSKLDTTSDNLPVTAVTNCSEAWINAIRMHMSEKDASAQLGQYLQAIVRRDWLLEGRALEEWKKAWLPV